MKKPSLLTLVALFCLFLTACNGEEYTNQEDYTYEETEYPETLTLEIALDYGLNFPSRRYFEYSNWAEAPNIAIWANQPLSHLAVFNMVNHWDEEQERITWTPMDRRGETPLLPAGDGFIIQNYIGAGTLPISGITFTDLNGYTRYFAMQESMAYPDGSDQRFHLWEITEDIVPYEPLQVFVAPRWRSFPSRFTNDNTIGMMTPMGMWGETSFELYANQPFYNFEFLRLEGDVIVHSMPIATDLQEVRVGTVIRLYADFDLHTYGISLQDKWGARRYFVLSYEPSISEISVSADHSLRLTIFQTQEGHWAFSANQPITHEGVTGEIVPITRPEGGWVANWDIDWEPSIYVITDQRGDERHFTVVENPINSEVFTWETPPRPDHIFHLQVTDDGEVFANQPMMDFRQMRSANSVLRIEEPRDIEPGELVALQLAYPPGNSYIWFIDQRGRERSFIVAEWETEFYPFNGFSIFETP
ncbi:MAG: hypothetical protein FWB98_00275 [Defluviitaleaceae bacterium]|nr:hypothetical protein [Defluviitaleaceae bacterium]